MIWVQYQANFYSIPIFSVWKPIAPILSMKTASTFKFVFVTKAFKFKASGNNFMERSSMRGRFCPFGELEPLDVEVIGTDGSQLFFEVKG